MIASAVAAIDRAAEHQVLERVASIASHLERDVEAEVQARHAAEQKILERVEIIAFHLERDIEAHVQAIQLLIFRYILVTRLVLRALYFDVLRAWNHE